MAIWEVLLLGLSFALLGAVVGLMVVPILYAVYLNILDRRKPESQALWGLAALPLVAVFIGLPVGAAGGLLVAAIMDPWTLLVVPVLVVPIVLLLWCLAR